MINALVQQLCKEEQVGFIDLCALLQKEGINHSLGIGCALILLTN